MVEILFEMGVISGLLIDGDRYVDEVREIVTAEDFINPIAKTIYESVIKIRERKEGLDMLSIFSEAGFSKPPDEAMLWVKQNPSSHYTVESAKRLRKSRLVEQVAASLQELKRSNTPENRRVVDALMRQMEEIDRHSQIKTGADIVEEMLSDFINADEVRKKTISTGFNRVDFLLDGGLRPGDLFIVGARTSVGKSSILWSLSESALRQNRKVLFFSAEMPAIQLGYRLAASSNRVRLKIIRRLESEGQKAIAEIADELKSWPLFVDDSGRLSMGALEAAVDRISPDVLVIDYLQRFKVSGSETRAAFFSDIANGLKSLAMQKRIIVYAASQLGRGVERDERPPVLSDFKESGGLEEAADVALLLWAKPEDMVAQVRNVKGLIAKNRNGSLGAVDFQFHSEQTRFEETSL